MCISKLARSLPPSVSINSQDYGLQTCSITAFKLAPSSHPSVSANSLDHNLGEHLQVHSVTASKCISKLARSQPPSVSLNSHQHGHQVHLQTRSITASKDIFMEGRWVYGHTGVTEVDRVTGSIFGRPWSRLTSHFHHILSYNENTLSSFPNF